MTTVKVSPKYQVVIPKEIRKRSNIKPGQRLQIIQIGENLELMPIKDIKKTRGILKGMNSDFIREEDRI